MYPSRDGCSAQRKERDLPAHPMHRFDQRLSGDEEASAAGSPLECRFFPYQDNGGTVVAVAGEDFAVMVADSRLSTGYRIHTRNNSKCLKLTSNIVLGSAGMQADMLALQRVMKARVQMYCFEHRSEPTISAVAQLLSTVLYGKRFFPYYTFNVLAGLDVDGKGAIYEYDAIGNFERSEYSAKGTGGALLTSVLDQQIGRKHVQNPGPPQSKDEIVDLLKDCITGAAERDIYTGDSAEIFMIDGAGVGLSTMELRRD